MKHRTARLISCAVALTIGLPLLASSVASDDWTVIGQGGGGAMFLPLINPADSQNVILRSDMTGTFMTNDGGQSWQMHNFLNPAEAFAFDAADPRVVWVAGVGLWRTDDRGTSWNLRFPLPESVERVGFWGDHADPLFHLEGDTTSPKVTSVRLEPETPGALLIGLEDGSFRHSRDDGRTWTTLDAALPGRVLAIFPGSWWERPGEWIAVGEAQLIRIAADGSVLREDALPGDAILTCKGGAADGRAVFYALAENAVHVSRDLGRSWKQVRDHDTLYEDIRFRSLGVSEGNPEVAYVGVHSRPFGIIKTEDGGAAWRWVYKVNPAPQVADYEIVVGEYEGAWMDAAYGPEWREDTFGLAVDANDPDICYATDYGAVYRTLDGGKLWQQVYTKVLEENRYISRGIDLTNCLGVHFNPFDQDHILANYNDIGAWASHDGGKSWSHAVNGIPRGVHVGNYWILFDPEVPGRVWSTWGSRHDLPRHKMFRHGRFLQGARGGVAESSDAGASWNMQVDRGIPPDAVCTHIILDPASPPDQRTLYVSAFQKGIYKSEDGGASWRLLPQPPSGRNLNFWRLALSDDGMLYALVVRDRRGTRWDATETPGGLFRSSDGGESWELVSLPRGYDFPTDLAFAPDNSRRMYLSMWPGSAGAGLPDEPIFGGGLLVTDDAGENWRQVFDPTSYVFATEIDPENPARVFLVTFEGAAFYSTNSGQSWAPIRGYDFKWGQRPKLDPRDPDRLFITTFGGGIWHGPAEGNPDSARQSWFDPDWRWTHPSIH